MFILRIKHTHQFGTQVFANAGTDLYRLLFLSFSNLKSSIFYSSLVYLDTKEKELEEGSLSEVC